MAKLYDINGNEVEAFTPDELKTKQEEAVAEHLKNNPDKSAELTKLQAELEDAKSKLVEANKGGNDQQKARLKEAKEVAEAALKSVTDKFTGEISALKESLFAGTKGKVMKAISKGDKDLEAKLDLKYQSLMKTGEYKNDEAGITQALTDAATLVTGSRVAPNFMDNISGAGERGATQKNGASVPESDNAKAMRNAFGISDKDAAKYTGIDATKGIN